MKYNQNKNPKILWDIAPRKIRYFYINHNKMYKQAFTNIVLNKFQFNNSYSLLLRVEYDSGKYGMAGNQLSFQFNSENYLQILNNLYYEIVNRLNSFKEFYYVEDINSVQVLFVKVDNFTGKEEFVRKLQISPTRYHKEYANNNLTRTPAFYFSAEKYRSTQTKPIKYSLDLLPLSLDTDYYGKLIMGNECNRYSKLINGYYNLICEDGVIDYDFMHIYNNKYIILSTVVDNHKIFREVFNLKSGILEAKCTDVILSTHTFERQYPSTKFIITNNKIIQIISEDITLPVCVQSSPTPKMDVKSYNSSIGTFNLKTVKDELGNDKVYLLGFCILNQTPVTFYLDASYSFSLRSRGKVEAIKQDLIVECLKIMLTSRYNGYIFYTDNLSYNHTFILNKLKAYNDYVGEEFFRINTLYRGSLILKLEISNNKNKIVFLDYTGLLKGGLRDIAKLFNLHDNQRVLPHEFITLDTLDYEGDIPPYDSWKNMSLDSYNELSLVYKSGARVWNLKKECLLYLGEELLILLNIMNIFNKYINQRFDTQLTDSLTISELSLNIFIKDYLKDSKIPVIKGKLYDDIKLSCHKDVAQVYKPFNTGSSYHYRVDFIHSHAALKPMCGNTYTYIEGGGLKLKDLFGYFFCEIQITNKQKDSLLLGLLPACSKTGDPLTGKWEGWYFSEELKFASENGYKITVLKGYNFSKEHDVLNNYVNSLYRVKSTTNNLVEKWVMENLLENLLPSSYYDAQAINTLAYGIGDNKRNNEFESLSLLLYTASTAYARIHMGKLKLDIFNKKGHIYYADAHTVITDINLCNNINTSSLGQLKLLKDKSIALACAAQDNLDFNNSVKVFNSKSVALACVAQIDTNSIDMKNVRSSFSMFSSQRKLKLSLKGLSRRVYIESLGLILELLLLISAMAIICIIAYYADLDASYEKSADYTIPTEAINWVKNDNIEVNCPNRPYIFEFTNIKEIPVQTANRSINIDYAKARKIHKVYDNTIKEIISNNLANKKKFTSLKDMTDFSINYLLKEIKLGRLKITTSEFESIVKLVYNTKKNNYNLYTHIFEEPSLYNLISRSYVYKYETSAQASMRLNNHNIFDPIGYKFTNLEELDSLNKDYVPAVHVHKWPEYEFLNNNIRKSLIASRSETLTVPDVNARINSISNSSPVMTNTLNKSSSLQVSPTITQESPLLQVSPLITDDNTLSQHTVSDIIKWRSEIWKTRDRSNLRN